MKEITLEINFDQYLEVEKLALGVFSPLKGFMAKADYASCVERLCLSTGEIFSIPIVLDVDSGFAKRLSEKSVVLLKFQNSIVGRLTVSDVYTSNRLEDIKKIFGTNDLSHPGVDYFFKLKEYFIGGIVELFRRPDSIFLKLDYTPEQTKKIFNDLGWKTVVGFQTRNVPHRAHEYLQKVALEHVDGIFIQPLVGRKKIGDYAPEAIVKGYDALIENYYPKDRAVLGILSTVMRYAGPREAIFHAIIRRNYGCTHFIVGRDHAGVGNYYDKYAAHNLISTVEDHLGIRILKLSGPFYCSKCDSMATEKTCPHYEGKDGNGCVEISGTMIRKLLKDGEEIPKHLIRSEVVHSLKGLDVFIS